MSQAEQHAYDEHLSAIMIQNDVLDGAKLEGFIEGKKDMGPEPEKIRCSYRDHHTKLRFVQRRNRSTVSHSFRSIGFIIRLIEYKDL